MKFSSHDVKAESVCSTLRLTIVYLCIHIHGQNCAVSEFYKLKSTCFMFRNAKNSSDHTSVEFISVCESHYLDLSRIDRCHVHLSCAYSFVAPETVCPSGQVAFECTCLRLVAHPQNYWEEANAICKRSGGDLVTIQ